MPDAASAIAFARTLGVDPRDAELLLVNRTRITRTTLLAHPERRIPMRTAHAVTQDIVARSRGVPLAYLLGYQEFFGLTITVTPATLIPRPETEVLVEETLRKIPKQRRFRIADLGTGSGCIAVVLATLRPELRVHAVDASPHALTVARGNARSLHVTGRVRFHRGNLLAPLGHQPIDAVVANLPYLPRGPLPPFEPENALAGGSDGLRHFRTLFRQLERSGRTLRFLALEIDPRNLAGLHRLVPKRYRTTVVRDLAGRNRVVVLEPRT